MIIQGNFIGDVPYFVVHIESSYFHGDVRFLADTGASITTLLDRDYLLLRIPFTALEPLMLPVVGIGGSVRSFTIKNVKFTFNSDNGPYIIQQDLCIALHDLEKLPAPEASRLMRLPSVLGRDILNRFNLSYNYKTGIIQLEDR